MTVPGEGFPKAARVRRRREYLAIGRSGRRCATPHFVVVSQPRPAGSRLGITVSRKVGGAITRNYVKRCVREIFRRDEARLWPQHDLVVIAKPGAGELVCDEIARELRAAIAKAERSTRN
jgi:ribonuclease P protein component